MPNYDVIIVGAGSVGVPTAMALAEKGVKTLVVDKHPSAGQGENKHAIGGIRATHTDPAKIRVCLRSLEIFSTWQDTFGQDIEWLKGGYVYPVYRKRRKNCSSLSCRSRKNSVLTSISPALMTSLPRCPVSIARD